MVCKEVMHLHVCNGLASAAGVGGTHVGAQFKRICLAFVIRWILPHTSAVPDPWSIHFSQNYGVGDTYLNRPCFPVYRLRSPANVGNKSTDRVGMLVGLARTKAVNSTC